MGQVQARVLGNASAFGRALREDLREARNLSVAVAFAKESALDVLDMESFCRSGHELKLLAGTDFALTELDLLKRLGRSPGAECRIFHSIERRRTFHPKLYMLDKGPSRVVYVGSSNLTRGGLADNIEANVRLEGPREAAEIDQAVTLFDSLFGGEYSTPISDDFERRYREMQQAMRAAQAYPTAAEHAVHLRVAEKLLLGEYRAHASNKRWLLVTSPENFATCIARSVWGRQNEREIRAYSRGDVFFFHVTGWREIAAFGMFVDEPYHDDTPLWTPDRRGNFPWRIKIAPFAVLATRRVDTKKVLTALRPGAPSHWFNGFIQQSHSLEARDFDALRRAFELELRAEQTLDPMAL